MHYKRVSCLVDGHSDRKVERKDQGVCVDGQTGGQAGRQTDSGAATFFTSMSLLIFR